MNRVYYLLLILMLASCGKKQPASYKDFLQAHERDRNEHLRHIENSWLFDTLASQTIDHMKAKDDKERVLDSWEHTSGYFKEMCINQQVYSHVVVLNDHTHEAVMKMWAANNELMMVNSLQTSKATAAIKFNTDYNEAIGIIQAMRTDVKKAMEKMLQGAEEYQKIIFEQK